MPSLLGRAAIDNAATLYTNFSLAIGKGQRPLFAALAVPALASTVLQEEQLKEETDFRSPLSLAALKAQKQEPISSAKTKGM